MKNLAFLEYTFLFEPESAWANIYDFERDLAKFLKASGFEAQIVDAVKGSAGRRIVLIKRITDILSDPSKSWREAAKKK